MAHYVCTGECGVESTEAGVCQDDHCSKQGNVLTACDCEDQQHYGAVQAVEEDDTLASTTNDQSGL